MDFIFALFHHLIPVQNGALTLRNVKMMLFKMNAILEGKEVKVFRTY